MDENMQSTAKKPVVKKWWFWLIIVLAVLAIVGIALGGGNSGGDSSNPDSSTAQSESQTNAGDTSKEAEKTDITYESVSMELTNGYFTAGIDFPAGTYDITAIAGNGNVSSDNLLSGGINAVMGVKDDDMYQKEYKNISLPKDTVLSIKNVTVRITCENPTSGTVKRGQSNTETVKLGNGNYVAGTDFPAGVYDIVAVSGNGNVSSDNLLHGGINAIMGIKDDEMYQKKYMNIELAEGTTLTIKRVEVELIPSK